MFDIDNEELTFKQWMCVHPKKGTTGCGIIVEVIDVPESRVEMYDSKHIYVVMTDFGNTLPMTQSEIEEIYTPTRYEPSPVERWERQLELLKENIAKYSPKEGQC